MSNILIIHYRGFTVISFEVYRVNWLRAKARFQRWDEELVTVEHEMRWTVKFYKVKKEQWETWAAEREMEIEESDFNQGLQSYAYKQAHTWKKLEARATAVFEKNLGRTLM